MKRQIPIVVPIKDDELLYSWVYRLHRANLYKSRRAIEKIFNKGQIVEVDGLSFSRDFLLSSRFNQRQFDAFMNHTLYPFYAIFFNKGKQEIAVSLQRLGLKKDSPLDIFDEHPDEIKYCTECIKEEGIVSLKRSHQLPGVNVCSKHKCRLRSIKRSFGDDEIKEIEKIMRNRELIEPEFLMVQYLITEEEFLYAEFMKRVLYAAFDMDLEDLCKIIKERVKDLNLNDRNDITNYFHSKGKDISFFRASALLSAPMLLSEDFLQTNLFTLFGDFDTFNSYYLKFIKNSEEKAYNEELYDELNAFGYRLVSPYRKNLVEISHGNCGESFLVTEYGLQAGLRCPSCQKLSVSEYSDMVISKDELNEEEEETDLFPISADPCLEVNIEISSDNSKDSKLSLEEAQDEVNTVNEDFYTPNYQMMVEDFTNDQYELVSQYKGDGKPIEIRHKDCGVVTEYKKAADFLDGERCPICSSPIKEDDFRDYVKDRSLGTYEVLEFVPEVQSCTVLITPTGEEFTIKKSLLLQELEKEQFSQYVPCCKDDSVKRPISLLAKFLQCIKDEFRNEWFELKDLENLGFTKNITKAFVKKLLKYGVLARVENNYIITKQLDK